MSVKRDCTRKVFGRRRVEKDGTTFVIEMKKDRVEVRELYSRKRRALVLGELIDLCLDQKVMRLFA